MTKEFRTSKAEKEVSGNVDRFWPTSIQRRLSFIYSSFCILCLLWFAFLNTPLLAQLPGAPPGPKLVPLPHPNIPAPEPPSPGLDWWLLSAGAVVLALCMLLLLWLLFKAPAKPPVPGVPPLDQALQRLKELASQVSALAPTEVSHQVSVILRDYQLDQYGMPAPWRTSEELYGERSQQSSARAAQRFGPLASIYDRLSFGRHAATKAEATALVESARQALEQERGAMVLPFAMPPPLPPPLPRPVPPPPLPSPLPTAQFPS